MAKSLDIRTPVKAANVPPLSSRNHEHFTICVTCLIESNLCKKVQLNGSFFRNHKMTIFFSNPRLGDNEREIEDNAHFRLSYLIVVVVTFDDCTAGSVKKVSLYIQFKNVSITYVPA